MRSYVRDNQMLTFDYLIEKVRSINVFMFKNGLAVV